MPSKEGGWTEGVINTLYDFLEDNNSCALLLLKDRKIVLENYWGKTLTTFLVGKGQEEIILPGFPTSVATFTAPNAPTDFFAGLSKNGQFVDVVPSQNRVVIRMGMAPDDALVPVQFHDEMWRLISGL